jgi:hypothetical protein
MLLKRYSFDVNHGSGKNNDLPIALSIQPGDEIFVEDPAEAEAFLPLERIKPEGPEFLAFLNAAELHRQIVNDFTMAKTSGVKTVYTGSTRRRNLNICTSHRRCEKIPCDTITRTH